MKKLLLLSAICTVISFSTFGQVTYLIDTAFTTDIGYDGAPASCVFTGGTATGLIMDRSVGIWVGDAFTVPAGSTWTIDTVILYGIQRYSGTTSTFTSCNVQIYNEEPGVGGGVIWGDTTTNVLVSTGFTGIYRVDTNAAGGLMNTVRPIMYLKLHLSPAPVLRGGTYWLSWSTLGTLSSAYTTGCPPKVLPGRINPPGQMGLQYFDNEWHPVVNDGQPLGFNKILKSSGSATGIINVNSISPIVLYQNVPNPFNGSTGISFYLQQAGYVKLSVYNTIGQLVTTLFDGDTNMGEHHVTFNADDLSAGIYFYRLSTKSGSESKQMLLVK
jgi:hypothetical protein